MLIKPKQEIPGTGSFSFGTSVRASANPVLDTEIAHELWEGFTFTVSKLQMEHTDSLTFTVGACEPIPVGEEAYTIRVCQDGIAIAGKDEKCLIEGYLTMLTRIHPVCLEEGREELSLGFTEIRDRPDLPIRMIHYCIFPDSDFYFIRKLIRLSAVLKFTHVVLEFWGTLKLDCMAELSWPNMLTKEDVRPWIREANDLGVEIIPMFNHWGHAAASREMHGRHVFLDQNPRLATLFSDNGWVWRIDKPEVRALHKKIRRELIELCGEGSYFHIGCDEAYALPTVKDAEVLLDFLRDIADDLEGYGRRPILWGDMFLPNIFSTKEVHYTALCDSKEVADYLAKNFDRRLVVADWQYYVKTEASKTAKYFRDLGITTLECPWSESVTNTRMGILSAKEYGLPGAMQTTWHTLEHGTPQIGLAAAFMWNEPTGERLRQAVATLIRKCMFAKGDIKLAGWPTNTNL